MAEAKRPSANCNCHSVTGRSCGGVVYTAGMAQMMPLSNFVVKAGCADTPARRAGSGVHDEGHREGGA